ncbi:DUF2530 domain-containing protein [Streptomyces sp. NPDC051740]|uniref:DUF2530 domain-containing protein n=1 Tax=Streptomyces sp. NPDC051740 TaxID=3365673 RepID=UPI0037B7B637
MAGFFSGSPEHEAPEPLEGPVVATIVGGTIIWFVLFLVQLPFYGWFDDHGHTWWLWTCLAGGGLGFIGIWYVRRRDAAIKRGRPADGEPDRSPAPRPTEPDGRPLPRPSAD